jgi:hypothetical protein
METLNEDERELLDCVEEQDVVAYLKKIEYQASDPRQKVKAGASTRGMYSQVMHKSLARNTAQNRTSGLALRRFRLEPRKDARRPRSRISQCLADFVLVLSSTWAKNLLRICLVESFKRESKPIPAHIIQLSVRAVS